jgi:hypothetical protein
MTGDAVFISFGPIAREPDFEPAQSLGDDKVRAQNTENPVDEASHAVEERMSHFSGGLYDSVKQRDSSESRQSQRRSWIWSTFLG